MKLLFQNSAMKLGSCHRIARYSNEVVQRSLRCQPVVSAGSASVLPNTVAARHIHSLNDASYFSSRGRSSFAEPFYMSKQKEEECDPQRYGYRVVKPLNSRGYTTTAAAAGAAAAVLDPVPAMNAPDLDEYSFIMSSPCPVSEQQCQKRQINVLGNTSLTGLEPQREWNHAVDNTRFLLESDEAGDEWDGETVHEQPEEDDLDDDLDALIFDPQ
jgi:hypothetical protein